MSEIIGQVLHADRVLKKNWDPRGITNVVFMGMGEPLLNFDAVMCSVDVLKDDFGFGLSKRRITVSTAGVVPGIKKNVWENRRRVGDFFAFTKGFSSLGVGSNQSKVSDSKPY